MPGRVGRSRRTLTLASNVVVSSRSRILAWGDAADGRLASMPGSVELTISTIEIMNKSFRLTAFAIAIFTVACIPLNAAQPVQALPVGTLLPMMLNDNLDSAKSKPGQRITAKLKQDLSLPDGTRVKSGAELFGHIVNVVRGPGPNGARVVFGFDRIKMGGREYPITVGARAVASMMAIADAQKPINSVAPDGSSTWDYNSRQVGGDVVFGRKDVRSNDGIVGTSPEPGWVVGIPLGNPEAGCPSPENKNLQAFWLFSTSACGVYGDDSEEMKISRKPADNAKGEITLTSPRRVLVRGGGGLLLTVLPQPATQTVQ